MRLITFLLTISAAFSFSAYSQSWTKFHLINGCTIFNMRGENIKSFPGEICQFLDDGSYVLSSGHGIMRMTKKMETLWEVKAHVHHQVNLSPDKKRLLILSSDIFNGKNDVRQDKFIIMDLHGKVIHEQKASEIFRQIKVTPFMRPYTDPGHIFNAKDEISHFNSIYEIGEIRQSEKKPEWLTKGNVVVNSLIDGIFILSPDLKKVLHHTKFSLSENHSVHDVQVTERGSFLYFNNLEKPQLKKDLSKIKEGETFFPTLKSSVQEINPVNGQLIEEFDPSPDGVFFSSIMGSVQELDKDTWILSHYLNGTYLYSRSKKTIILNTPFTHVTNFRYHPTQQIKAEDLSKFLSHWL